MSGIDFEGFERDAHRAIGRYVVEFSRLVFSMRTIVTERLESHPPILAELTLGEAPANQIASAFFGVCRELAYMDDDEARVARRLRKRVMTDEIERRNDISHGDWFVDIARLGLVDPGSVYVIRIRPMRQEGAIRTIEVRTTELDRWSDSASELRAVVAKFGAICTGARPFGPEGIRIGDIFTMQSGEVVRAGPRAGDFPAYT